MPNPNGQNNNEANNMSVEDKLKQLNESRDYRGIVDLMFDVHQMDIQDEGNKKAFDTVSRFVSDLCKPEEGKKTLNPENEEILLGIWNQMCIRNCEVVYEKGIRLNDWEKRIQNGEIEGTELIADDPKTRREVAHDLLIVREGGPIVASNNLITLMNQELPNIEIQGRNAMEYLGDMELSQRSDYCEEKKIPLEQLDGFWSEVRNTNTKEKYHHFHVKFGEVGEGEMLFDDLPEEIKTIRGCQSEKELTDYGNRIVEEISKKEKYAADVMSSVDQAKELLGKYRSNRPADDAEAYDEMLHTLEDYTKLGTNYRFIDDELGVDVVTEAIDSITVSKALNNLEAVSDGFAVSDELKEFVNGVKNGPMSLQVRNPETKNEKKTFKMVNHEKQSRGMEYEKFDKYSARVDDVLKQHKSPFNLQGVYGIVQFLKGAGENYPEHAEKMDELADEIVMKYAMMAGSSKQREMQNGIASDKTNDFITDPADKRELASLIIRTCDMMDDMKAECVPGSIEHRVLEYYSKEMDFMKSDDYKIALEGDSDYEAVMRSTFLTFPSPNFATGEMGQDGKPEFKPDLPRYEAFMKRIPFLDQAEERQNFAINKIVPYEKKRTEGTLSDEDVQNFRTDYIEHLNQQEAYFNTIRSVSSKDKDITDNRTFVKNTVETGLVMNWQKNRFGDIIMNSVALEKNYLSKGWPVSDLTFLKDMERISDTLSSIKGGNAEYTPEEKQKYEKIYHAMQKPLDRLKNSYVSSADDRKKLLEGIGGPLKEFVKLDHEHRKKKNYSPSRIIKEDSIHTLFDAAMSRQVTELEVGKGGAVIDIHHDMAQPHGFDLDTIRKNVDYMMEDLKAVDPKWMKSSPAFAELKESLTQLQAFASIPESAYMLGEGTPYQKQQNMLNQFKSRMENVRKATETYLEYKGAQFDRDATRRDSKSKQKREQPRIRMALELHQKLSFMEDSIADIMERNRANDPEKLFETRKVPKMREKAQLKINERLAVEEKKLSDPSTSKGEYLRSLCTSLALYQQSKPSFYKRMGAEKFEDYKSRIENAGQTEFSDKEIKKFQNVNGIGEKLRAESANFGKEGHKRLGVEDIKKLYDAAFVSAVKEKTAAQDAAEIRKAAENRRRENAAEYKNKLVSKPKR